jgi:hypothetical protein
VAGPVVANLELEGVVEAALESFGQASTASLDRPTSDHFNRSANRGFLPGVVAGAVLRAARLSAGMSEARLAIVAALPLKAIRDWEEGSSLLAAVPLREVDRLQTALRKAGADPRLVADFGAAPGAT